MSEENQNLEPENNTIPDEQSAVDVEDTSNQGEEGKPTERLYAGKYKSIEELEKGYENLQKKFSTKEESKPVEEKPKDTPKELNYEDASLENVQHIAKELDVDWDKITAEFYDNAGQLSDESYQDLISKGIPKSFIDKASVKAFDFLIGEEADTALVDVERAFNAPAAGFKHAPPVDKTFFDQFTHWNGHDGLIPILNFYSMKRYFNHKAVNFV